MKNKTRTEPWQSEQSSSLKPYIIGLVLSLLLTLFSYFAVVEKMLSGWALAITILLFGVVQAFVQLKYFLHLGNEPKPRWNLLAFSFMVLVLGVIVLGSLWIMYNLDYRMMPAGEGTSILPEGL